MNKETKEQVKAIRDRICTLEFDAMIANDQILRMDRSSFSFEELGAAAEINERLRRAIGIITATKAFAWELTRMTEPQEAEAE